MKPHSPVIFGVPGISVVITPSQFQSCPYGYANFFLSTFGFPSNAQMFSEIFVAKRRAQLVQL